MMSMFTFMLSSPVAHRTAKTLVLAVLSSRGFKEGRMQASVSFDLDLDKQTTIHFVFYSDSIEFRESPHLVCLK